MLHIQRMKPFYVTQEQAKVKLVFEYQYFTIKKGEELFHFIPSEGKEIHINLQNLQVENLGDIFVFQKGSRFIRLPLYQLLLISDIHAHLKEILQGADIMENDPLLLEPGEAENLIEELERINLLNLIDRALEQGDRDLFHHLTEQLNGTL
ncbi:IDEAL domain-containing protein [Bhargavaea beijingensis]|uniref:IDEAL domain-containing protein n=1 Tax=Bhargavaea beijingensis TaxID=426756 RepID=A0A1G7H7S3_9BACL|nr:IDEAL domain-containing protein [Bhargavaea beijingensis]MCW1928863.1 IDEAL domain-containing protein [Bhargavaea beijingensis]RSK29945.1 IDEAL domain-containing protein [Bhargavaea beijingensis]SDE96468.1 IDEAL domain-containing protein [Bhargavaea beijingensis]